MRNCSGWRAGLSTRLAEPARNPVPRGSAAKRLARGERSGLLAHVAKPRSRSRLRVREPRRLPRGLSQEEAGLLLGSFQHYLDRYQTNPDSARKLVTVGESPLDGKLNVSELAAYTTVASLILNLDETVTKE